MRCLLVHHNKEIKYVNVCIELCFLLISDQTKCKMAAGRSRSRFSIPADNNLASDFGDLELYVFNRNDRPTIRPEARPRVNEESMTVARETRTETETETVADRTINREETEQVQGMSSKEVTCDCRSTCQRKGCPCRNARELCDANLCSCGSKKKACQNRGGPRPSLHADPPQQNNEATNSELGSNIDVKVSLNHLQKNLW